MPGRKTAAAPCRHPPFHAGIARPRARSVERPAGTGPDDATWTKRLQHAQAETEQARANYEHIRSENELFEQRVVELESDLRALDTCYLPSRILGDQGALAWWNEFQAQDHLECGPVGAALEDHRYRRAYRATVDGKQYVMDQHIQGLDARDDARCFRLYFTLDKELGKIIVGRFPTHLRNALT